MADTVKVSLVQGRKFRLNKSDPYIDYPPGIREMPYEHARALGLLNRIVRQETKDDAITVIRDAFSGTFDEKLTKKLNDAGFHTLDDLRPLSRDAILAIEGMGPAAYERIQLALKEG